MVGSESSASSGTTWVSVIPKIGGSALGSHRVTRTLPLYHVSWAQFRANHAHLAAHWPSVPFLYLDQDPPERVAQLVAATRGTVDFVFAVCPCSGLSMLNTATRGRAARGADAEKNQWMVRTSQWVLDNIAPRVLIGENAPALFSEAGEKVVLALRQLAEQRGYSLSLVRTSTELHGLPQRRVRTFYFFWRSATAPLLRWVSRARPSLVQHLAAIPATASLQEVFIHTGAASTRYRPYQFVLEREGLSHAEFSRKFQKGTIAQYLERRGLLDECIGWLEARYPGDRFSLEPGTAARTHVQALQHIRAKLALGRGYWDDSLKFMGDSFTAVIKKNVVSAVHPVEDRFLSVREILHLMVKLSTKFCERFHTIPCCRASLQITRSAA